MPVCYYTLSHGTTPALYMLPPNTRSLQRVYHTQNKFHNADNRKTHLTTVWDNLSSSPINESTSVYLLLLNLIGNSLVSSCTDVGMARLSSTLSTAAHRSPILLAGSVSGRPHSKWWWCHDIGYPLLAAEHSPCKAPWSRTPCQMTSTQISTMTPVDSAWKPGFSLATSVLIALETVWQLRSINSHLP